MKNIFSKKNKALLSELVRTDFKLRYQNSVLGYAWSLLRPLLLFVILYVVFAKFLKLGNNIPHYPIYLLLGMVMWSFFGEMTSMSLGSIVTRGDLIRKIRIPRWMIIVSTSIAATINLGLNLIIVAVFMAINHLPLTSSIVWFPFIIAQVYIFSLAISLFLSAAFVKYRDVSYIWEVVLQAFFYLTPIFYPLSVITNVNLQKLLLLNPMAQSIQDARNVVVTKETITIAEVYGSGMARFAVLTMVMVIFVGSVLYFKRESKYFAENL